ncbi:MAG TPA: GspMb/PilO family protein [Candidatus Baltobacteraceae bacterium]|nr:GspMb/PilO family protein [Candidatus Baltobacteraceae bacterium]
MKGAWLAILAAAVAGYAGVVAPSEQTVRSLERESQDLYDLANRNEAVLAQRASLVTLHDRVRRDLDELGAEKTPAKAALALIQLLDREAEKRNVSVGIFAPEETGSHADPQRVALTLHGSYKSVLPLVSDLSRYRPLVEVESAELQRPSDTSDGSEIDAQVRVVLYHTTAAFTHTQTEVRPHDPAAHD